jgi:uncharacterized membrane-anchored protein
VLAPLTGAAGVEKEILTALVAIPVIGGVWWFVRRIRRRIDRDP